LHHSLEPLLGLEVFDTAKETLSAIVEPVAGQTLPYRELVGLCQPMASWLEALDGNNRLYPPLNPLGAETGRFSCRNPNLLAIPRGCFIADDPDARKPIEIIGADWILLVIA
jgi:hypothetical protein